MFFISGALTLTLYYFNTNKCQIIHFSSARLTSNFNHKFNGEKLI